MKIHDPPMAFKDDNARQLWEEGLANNTDPYGMAVYRFASEWATRAEREIPEGSQLGDVEDFGSMLQRTAHEANDEGITGFMYGVAVTLLAACWAHGETLRRWHNCETQRGNEGEAANEKGTVLNPALFNVTDPQQSVGE